MATLTVVPASSAGVDVIGDAEGCGASGDTFANSGLEVLIFTNAGLTELDVTIITPGTLDAHAIANRVVAVPAESTLAIGPFVPGAYNNAAGYVSMTYESETDLSVLVLKVTPA